MSTDQLETLREALGTRYRVERELGRGGTATVYLAQDLKHNRPVAVKVLRPDIAAAIGPERFLREIEIAARLEHPHILPLHDSGEAGGLLYYVMPYVEGESLRERLEREKQLSIDEARRIAGEVAAALAYAHEEGIVHRDIKPGNILLSEGYARVADFGLARAIRSAAGDSSITHAGLAVGTPHYMSPEQASGEDVDGRADIYSLGCVLYQMLGGEPPFTGPSPTAVLARQTIFPVPSLRTIRPTVPPWLERVVLKALQKVPADRFATAAEFGEALAGRRLPWLNRRRAAVLGLAAALLVVGAVWIGNSEVVRIRAWRPAPVDTSRYAVLPFDYDASVTTHLGEDQLLQDALARWAGISLIDRFQVSDALARREGRRLTSRDALTVARELGAGRYIRGSTSAVAAGYRLNAVLLDASDGELLAEHSVTVPASLIGADSVIGTLAERLLFRGALPGEREEVGFGTRSLPARQAFAQGQAAIANWDLIAADSAFGKALSYDGNYAQAALWLALVRAWAPQPPRTWRILAEQAHANREKLGARDTKLSEALLALGREEYAKACPAWQRVTESDRADFVAWYSLGECLRRDQVVVPDRRSPSGYSFRSSYHQSVLASRRAFELVRSIHHGFQGGGFEQVRRLFVLTTDQLREGFAEPPKSAWFVAYPARQGDTLVYVPWPGTQITTFDPATVPATMREAVAHQRLVLFEVASSWVAAFPRSADALATLAVALDLLGNRAAIDTARRARALAKTPSEVARTSALHAWMLVRQGMSADLRRVASAKAIADSVLMRASGAAPPAPLEIAGLALLTGRVLRAVELTHAPGFATSWRTPPALAADGLAFLIYAAAGGPIDSVGALERRLEVRIASSIEPSQRVPARLEYVARGASLAFPEYRSPGLAAFAQLGDYLVAAQVAYLRGDTASVRRTFVELRERRARLFHPSDLSLDALYPEARLLEMAQGPTAASAWLDPTLDALDEAGPPMHTSVVRAAVLVRSLAYRAELAARLGDRETAIRLARIVTTLWSDADPFLQPTVRRMVELTLGSPR